MSMFEILNNMIDNGVQQQSNNFIRASVTSPPPELKIKFDNVEIPSEQIYCSNFLLPHYHRTYRIDGVIDEKTETSIKLSIKMILLEILRDYHGATK